MEYKKEDREYLENLLSKSIKNENISHIWYLTNKNIQRQIKYNKLYNKNKEIKYHSINNKIIDDDIVIIKYTAMFCYCIFHKEAIKYFENRYINNYKKIMEDILNDIFNLEYKIIFINY